MSALDELEKRIFERERLNFQKLCLGFFGILVLALFVALYHPLMLNIFDYRQFSDLPTISGHIQKIEKCTSQTRGRNGHRRYQPVTIIQNDGSSSLIFPVCFDETTWDMHWKKSITVWRESFLFPTLSNAPWVGLNIDGNQISEPFAQLRKPPTDWVVLLLLPTLALAALTFLIYLFRLPRIKSSSRELAKYKQQALMMLKTSLHSIPPIAMATTPVEVCAPWTRYEASAYYRLSLYVKTINDSYWKFELEGEKLKFFPVDATVMKIKKLNLQTSSEQAIFETLNAQD